MIINTITSTWAVPTRIRRPGSCRRKEIEMIRAAIVGIGWWGRMLVNAVQGKSAAIRFTAGYTRTRATAEGFLR